MKRLLKNAHLICPVQGFDDIGHIGMTNGSISHSSLGSPKDESGFDEVIDCQGPVCGTWPDRYARSIS